MSFEFGFRYGVGAALNKGVRPIDLMGYYFASSRFRTPSNVGAVPAGLEYQISVFEFYSPPYACNHFRIALPAHYTAQSSAGMFAAPNDVHFEGVHLQAFQGSWQDKTATLNGQSSFTMTPGVGAFLDDVIFTTDVPANSRMQIRLAYYVAAGAQMIVSIPPSQATAQTAPFRTVASVEACVGGASSLASQLTASTKPTGTDARISGAGYCPAFVVAKPTSPLDRPVWLHNGDSKTWGKNENEVYLATKYLSMGFVQRTFDDDIASRRMPCCIMSVPGMGASEIYPASDQSYKLQLMQLVPNRPYTHLSTDHYNNSGVLDANYRSFFTGYFAMLRQLSRHWGNAAAPLYHFDIIPRPGSSNWATTLGGQNPTTNGDNYPTGYRWQFADDLASGYFSDIAGVFPTRDYYSYDLTTNRDKTKLSTATYTLAANYTSGATTISLTTAPPYDTMLVLNAASSSGATWVRGISGSGPYTVTLRQGVTVSGLNSGAVIGTTYVGDQVGLHPAPQGHELIAQAAIAYKQATFG
ncbi:hypothetical protein HGO38_01605 [Rhizobium sp. CG5]|uniref:hypothetical protein n=1 Tax=Rhizobium sp. CG5 TaxID=2726076 RepID=UPI0020337255|nr:hypothetical protein [Rhizobium sp. CG5]MCM2472172.1 hypothetical protein [Rhizobium sp. CG5]